MGFVRVETVFTLTEISHFFSIIQTVSVYGLSTESNCFESKKIIQWEICFTLDGS